MNSRQRRMTKRYWRYHVTLRDETEYEQYEEVRQWCRDKFGKIGYRWGNTWCYHDFDFRNERDCAMFMLKWL
jgi:hypothetical protein